MLAVSIKTFLLNLVIILDSTYHIGKRFFCTYFRQRTFPELISDILVNSKTRQQKVPTTILMETNIYGVSTEQNVLVLATTHGKSDKLLFCVWHSKILNFHEHLYFKLRLFF